MFSPGRIILADSTCRLLNYVLQKLHRFRIAALSKPENGFLSQFNRRVTLCNRHQFSQTVLFTRLAYRKQYVLLDGQRLLTIVQGNDLVDAVGASLLTDPEDRLF